MLSGSPSFAQSDDDLFIKLQHRSQYQNVKVERVISADTILLSTGEKIKLIGLSAPETPRRTKIEFDKNGQPIIPDAKPDDDTFETRALNFAVRLLEGQSVRLEFDEDHQDDKLVTVAYVFLTPDQTLANAEILRQGYADLKIRPPNLKYADRLREAYREARQEKRGLHGN